MQRHQRIERLRFKISFMHKSVNLSPIFKILVMQLHPFTVEYLYVLRPYLEIITSWTMHERHSEWYEKQITQPVSTPISGDMTAIQGWITHKAGQAEA